jgi:hypothetical protein
MNRDSQTLKSMVLFLRGRNFRVGDLSGLQQTEEHQHGGHQHHGD